MIYLWVSLFNILAEKKIHITHHINTTIRKIISTKITIARDRIFYILILSELVKIKVKFRILDLRGPFTKKIRK